MNGNGDLIGFNLFAYCGNNPIMFIDPKGYSCKEFLSCLLDFVFDTMEKSSNKTISTVGSFLKAFKSGYDKGEAISNIENPLNSSEEIKTQYVDDIYNVGVNDTYLYNTPDANIFPSVTEYNIQCRSMFNYLSNDPRYSDVSNTSFNKIEAKNTILMWDTATTTKLVLNTVYVSFAETMVEMMVILYA